MGQVATQFTWSEGDPTTTTDANLTQSSWKNNAPSGFPNAILIGVTVGSSARRIEFAAFNEYNNVNWSPNPLRLQTIDLTYATNLTYIGQQSFQVRNMSISPTNPIIVHIPSSVTTINYNAFVQSNISRITFASDSQCQIIESGTFDSSNYLTSINIPPNINTIHKFAFRSCSSLTSCTFDSNSLCTTLGQVGNYNFEDGTFMACTALPSITLPPLLNTIGDRTFYYCLSLTTLNFSDVRNLTQASQIGRENFVGVPSGLRVNVFNNNPSNPIIPAGFQALIEQFPADTVVTYYSGASCYNASTEIVCIPASFSFSLTRKEKETTLPISELKIGDYVKTYRHGYRKITHIGSSKMQNSKKHFSVGMFKHKYSNLTVTGGHSILLDDTDEILTEKIRAENKRLFYGKEPDKVDGKYFLLTAIHPDFERLNNEEVYTYYHLVLEPHKKQDRFAIWADSVLSETVNASQFQKAFQLM
jgi:hypothetical protein